MTINITQDTVISYAPGGYGSSIISLSKGVQEVNDAFAQFLLDEHSDVANLKTSAKASKSADVAIDTVPEVAPVEEVVPSEQGTPVEDIASIPSI